MSKKKITRLIYALLILLITGYIVPMLLHQQKAPTKEQNPVVTVSPLPAPQIAKVTRVIDGDTVEIETGQKVRYIGMDTPEMPSKNKKADCFALEATEKNKEIVLGKTVRLQTDVSDTDKYGRLLRYVFLNEPTASGSGLFVNKFLLEEGYATVLTIPPDVAFSDSFRTAQKEAMKQNKGLWGECK
ncbi:hypothetical protein HGA88_03455 [Candidatus Roizmanbacteria bacterium]|nr:hypothetical protein [Candidatus Roizmanbacteria bacterium]